MTQKISNSVHEKHRQFVEQHPSIKLWLQNYRPETRKSYMVYAYKFFKWVKEHGPGIYRGASPKDLLDMQDTCVTQRDLFKQVELVKAWMRTMKAAYRTKIYMKSIIYSFYAANHVPLPRDVNFKIRPDRETVDGYLSIDELKNIILSSNKLYQAVFTTMFQSAMGEEEFVYFNTHSWSQIKEQLDRNKKVIRIDLPGRKHRNLKPGGRFFTFFGRDTITKLKEYLGVRGQLIPRTKDDRKNMQCPPLEEAIFINEKWKPLSKGDITTYFKRHAIKLGIIRKRYGEMHARYRVHTHEMRDTFRTEWNLTPAKPVVAEFFMGHTIDRNNYNKILQRPEWAEEQYRLAEPWLNILSEDPRKVALTTVRQMQKKIEELEKRNVELKARLNGTTLTGDQVQELLRRIEKLEKLAQEQG